MEYIIALDQGTSSSRAILYDLDGEIISLEQEPITMIYPQDGWVEQKPDEIWESILRVGRQVIDSAGIEAQKIRALGIANQRETTLVWDKITGKCIYNAIVWQDRRTTDFCKKMSEEVWEGLALSQYISERTGLIIDPYFSSTKLAWILSEIAGDSSGIDQKNLLFGTVDSYLIWKLTGGEKHLTEVTNASRTQLFDIDKCCWDKNLLDYFEIPSTILPAVQSSADDFGVIIPELFGAAIPICGVAGDQQAALIGQGCVDEGMSKATVGTGCFIMTHTGKVHNKPSDGLLTTVAYRIKGEVNYASEGSIFVAGQAVKWLRDQMGMISDVTDTEKAFVQTQGDSHGIYVVPAFTGLGAPHWDPQARGLISGLTLDSTVEQIIVATLQSIAYQIADLVDLMGVRGAPVAALRIDGGMASNRHFCQFLSDILGLSVDKPRDTETTARGAAILAGLGAGIWNNLEEAKNLWQPDEIFTPNMKMEKREKQRLGFKKAVSRAKL